MKCPGQDTQYWNADAVFDVPCPECRRSVEFFKDDTTRRCGHCGHRFVNPKMDFGCAAYCQYAEQCLGDLPPELAAQQADLLKDRVAIAVKRHLKSDFRRIGHITRRAHHAEQIARQNSGQVDVPVVLITAFLWDFDPAESENEVPTAKSILTDLKAPPPLIERVCILLSQRGSVPAQKADVEYKIVSDADQQACLEASGRHDA